MNQEFKYSIIEMLKNRGAYSVSTNGKQHYTRCPYCGDSRNINHAHMSIKIDLDNDTPMVYRCLKCDAHGLVTAEVLEELELYVDKEILDSLKSYNKKAMRYGKLTNNDKEKFSVPLYTDSSINARKLEYLNNRLGIDYTYTDARDNKLVLNLFDFIKFNEIEKIDGLYPSMLKSLDENYIGFLSCNNNNIIFRDITGEQKFRYYKVMLNPKNINSDSFYSIPNKISLMYTNKINIHIAEGTFDILSIKENVVQNTEDNFFFAMCGFGGISILKYLIHHGINTGLNIHIYSDNDKTNWDHRKILYNKSYITEWIDNIYIHRNQMKGEKDYGVTPDRIKDSWMFLK